MTSTCEQGSCTTAPVPGQRCSNGWCNAQAACVACTMDTHCDDSNDCTLDTCGPGPTCMHTITTAPRCGPGLQLFCRNDGQCVECLQDGDCDDGKACTFDRCMAGVCSNPARAEGAGVAGCGGVCDGAGGCVQCTDNTHCAECEDCVLATHTCGPNTGRTCSGTLRCSDYLFGTATTSGYVGCYAYADVPGEGQCFNGTCADNLSVGIACNNAGRGAPVFTCSNACADFNRLGAGCPSDQPTWRADNDVACYLDEPSPNCQAESCSGSASNAYVRRQSCNSFGTCVNPTVENCGNFACVLSNGTASCKTSCTTNADCVALATCQGSSQSMVCCESTDPTPCP